MKWFLILLTTVFLVGCAGSSPAPKTHVYLLRADVDDVQNLSITLYAEGVLAAR